MITTAKQKLILHRILRESKKEDPKGCFIWRGKTFVENGYQWFCSNYILVGINTVLDEFERVPFYNAPNVQRILDRCKSNIEIEKPDVKLLRQYLRDQKAVGGCLNYSFGFAYFRGSQLLQLLELFPDAKLYHSGKWYDLLFFRSAEGVGLLIPLRPTKEMGGKVPQKTLLKKKNV